MRTINRITLRARHLVELYIESTAKIRDDASQNNGGKSGPTTLSHASAQNLGTAARRIIQDPFFHTLQADLQDDVRDIARWCETRHREPPAID